MSVRLLRRSRKVFEPILARRASSVKIDFLSRIQDKQRQQKIAVVDPVHDLTLTYGQLDQESTKLASFLQQHKDFDSNCQTIGILNKPTTNFVISLLAAWKLGKIAVPLCTTHTAKELHHVVTDSDIKTVLTTGKDDLHHEISSQLPTRFIEVPPLHIGRSSEFLSAGTDSLAFASPKLSTADEALIVYTSGTTARPKGVVHTHGSLHHMLQGLTDAWEYTPKDKVLHFLPLYHVHGLMNKLLCVLFVGGCVEFTASSHATLLWKRLAEDADNVSDPLTMFHAVPTVYSKMLECVASLDETTKSKAISVMQRMRFMACGSAALPDVVMDQWHALTGQTLLERYGMTELGMALSNPYNSSGTHVTQLGFPGGSRKKGSVGFPLPFVEARIVNDQGNIITSVDSPGELQISGPCVFKHYLNNPKATAESFTEQWFKTGDVAQVDAEGRYKILGRSSSDIIKHSGYKISALEIERELLSHSNVLEAAVLGVPDVTQGESILCVLVFRRPPQSTNVAEEMTNYLNDKLVKYKLPQHYVVAKALPRNHLGKVNKKTLLNDLHIKL